MPAYTLKQIRDLIDPSCFPPGASDAVKTSLINKAREAIYNCPESGGGNLWKGTMFSLPVSVVTQSDGTQTATLPRTAQTFLGGYCGDNLIKTRNRAFSYLRMPGGEYQSNFADDLGDGFCGELDPPSTGSFFKIQTTSNEASSLAIVVYGTDVNGNPISESVSIPTVSGSYAQTSNTFYSITEIVKASTAGDLLVYLTDGINTTFYSRYKASEVKPNYRRYRIGSGVAVTQPAVAPAVSFPTTDPHVSGAPWNNGGFLCISQG